MSHHSLLELRAEIESTKKHKIRSILRWSLSILFLLYLLIGLIPYLYFGERLITFDYGNILLSYDFDKLPIIICNALVIIFVTIANILKFRPAKDIFTCMFRKTYRESTLWNAFSITMLQVLQTILSCLFVKMKISLSSVCYLISAFSVPLITIIFPFLAYHLTFYYDEKVSRRRVIYLLFMFIAIFIYISVLIDLIFRLLNREMI